MNRLLDRLEFLQSMPVERSILVGVPAHRIARLRRQGERYFAGDLRDISGDRRLTILVVCALEWRRAIAEAVVGTHDRIVGKTWCDAFRSGDIWLAYFRQYGDLKDALVPAEVARITPKLAMPYEPEIWLADRKSRLADGLQRLARTARAGAIPGGSIEDGVLKIDRLTAAVPEEADAMVLDLYKRLPEIRITDLLLEVNDEIGFTRGLHPSAHGRPMQRQGRHVERAYG